MTCTRNISLGAGKCTITASDPNMVQYLLFHNGDEIEIFIALNNTAIKVWGGYIQTLTSDNNKGQQLVISGSEYAIRLINQTITTTFSGTELSDANAAILSNQFDFIDAESATIGKPISAEYTGETMFNALQKQNDSWGYAFTIDMDKQFKTSLKSIPIISADNITAGDNVTKERQDIQNQEYLCNSVTVYGSGGVFASDSDPNSITEYGLHSKVLTIASLSTTAQVQQYATQFISDNKDPKPTQRFKTKILPYTDPTMYIPINVPSLGLDGDYQIIEITHNWGSNYGLNSEMEISNSLVNTTRLLGSFERRIRDVEGTVF